MAKVLTALRLFNRAVLRRDPNAAFAFLQSVGRSVYPRYRFTEPEVDLAEDEAFHAFLERFGEVGWDRRWMVSQLVRLTRDLPGDTAECGAFNGATSWLICASNQKSGRSHHVFDSFEGLSQPNAEDGTHWRQGDFTATEEEVRANLSPFDRVHLHKGWIPELFEDVSDRRFAFVHIDVDLHQPTADSIEFFYPRVVNGGILVCDDYGHTSCPGATRAMDDYLVDTNEKMLSLPAGGGFFIKGTATSAATALSPR